MCKKMGSPILLMLLFLSETVLCARILVFIPTVSYSHQVIVQPIIKELSLRGHQVVSITPNPINDTRLTNLTEVDVSSTYSLIHSKFNLADQSGSGIAQNWFLRKIIVDSYTHLVTDAQLGYPDVKRIINDSKEKFDLVIIEWVYYMSLAAFSERFNCPLVGITSMIPLTTAHWKLGNSVNPAYHTDAFLAFSAPENVFQRTHSALFNLWWLSYYHWYVLPEQDRIARKHFGNGIRYIGNTEKMVSLVLSNEHPAWTGSRPEGPALISIAGIYKKPRKPLPQDLQAFLDEAKEGVVYFSLGSNIKSNKLSEEKRQIFIEAFNQLPYKILWKFESEDLPRKPDKVKIYKWLPQSDVLYHPNVKVFITQGGMQSWEEAINARVPLIGIPFMGDQYWNVDRMKKLGIGIELNFDYLTVEQLIDSVQKIMTNPSYHEKITELSTLLNEYPDGGPLSRAVWWIEYVLRHRGAPALRSSTADLPLYQLLLLDVAAVLLLALLLPVLICRYALRLLIRSLRKSTKLKTA